MLLRSLLAFAALIAPVVANLERASAQGPSTLAQIKQRNALNCGVDTGLAGFAFKDDKGVWKGLDVDYCRAIAAAVFKDPEKVNYVPLTTKVRFTALKGQQLVFNVIALVSDSESTAEALHRLVEILD